MKRSLRDVQSLVIISLNRRGVAGRELARLEAFSLRGLHHLLPVLVSPGQEKHVLAVEPLKARDRIGRDHLIGVADMRNAVRISDGGGDVVDVARERRPAGGAVRREHGLFALRAFGDGF